MPPKRAITPRRELPLSPAAHREKAAAAAPTAPTGVPSDELAWLRRRTVRSLSAAMFCQFFTSTMVQQAQIAVALRLSAGNRALVISRMSLMQSVAAAIQFLVTPLFGALSDRYGRRPILQGSNILGATLRLSVVLFPSWTTLALIKTAGMNCSNAFRTGVDAALSDVFEGASLAVASSEVKSIMGFTMLIAPIVGGWLTDISPYLPFVVSSGIGFLNSVLIRVFFKETAKEQTPQQRTRSLLPNPLGFVKLFRNGRQLALLTLSTGIQSITEFGPHGIDRHFAAEAVGMTNSQEGYYSSIRGLAVIIGGKLVKPLLERLGTTRFVALGNWSCFMFYAVKASARGPLTMFGHLIFYVTGGHTFRIAPLMAMHTRRALDVGMSRGEVAAARSNFEALLKVAAPQVFSFVYTSVRDRPQLQGAPYVLCALLVVLAHGLFSLIGAQDVDRCKAKTQTV
jgi:DHA1 family tetracycline resistance protein-like MFS transporter